MSRDSEDEGQPQIEESQEATPGGARQGGAAAVRRPSLGGIRGGMAAARRRVEGLPRPVRWGMGVAVIALAAAMPTLMPYITVDYLYWDSILVKIGIAALLALGLNVVVGFAGLLDLGYVAFFAVGAYSYAFMSGAARYSVAIQNVDPNATQFQPHWHMYYWLYFIVALGIALLAGVLLGAPTLRLRGDYLAIVTLGFGEIVRITANNLGSQTGGPRGVLNIPHPEINVGSFHYDFGLQNPPYYWLVLGIIIVWIILLRRLNNSRVGRAWAAIREDELAAAATGVATVRMKLWAFSIGASVACLGGVIYASLINFISPNTFTLFNPAFGSVIILAMVVLGGMGGIAGPILGAAMIIFLPERFRSVGDARFLLFGLALVAIMILRPQGLIPSRRRAAELTGGEIREGSVYEARRSGE